MKLVLAAALLSLSSVTPAGAQDSFMSKRPQGFAGEGHAEHHDKYLGLTNKLNGAGCSGRDCRPSQSRWNPNADACEVMVDGRWQLVPNDLVILDDAWLQHIGRPRWDQQAHVCASEYKSPDGTHRVYCLIPGASGQ